MTLYESWLQTCESADIPAISFHSCCKLLAILYVFGGNSENFTHNLKLVADIKYAQKQSRLDGGKTPDALYVREIGKLARELEMLKYDGLLSSAHPNHWAVQMMNKYNIRI